MSGHSRDLVHLVCCLNSSYLQISPSLARDDIFQNLPKTEGSCKLHVVASSCCIQIKTRSQGQSTRQKALLNLCALKKQAFCVHIEEFTVPVIKVLAI